MSRRLKRGFVATTDSKKGEPIKNVKREREIERQNQGECLTAVALLLPWRDCNCFGIIFKKVGNKHTLFFSLTLSRKYTETYCTHSPTHIHTLEKHWDCRSKDALNVAYMHKLKTHTLSALSLSFYLSVKKFLMPHTEFSSQLRLCLSSKREI